MENERAAAREIPRRRVYLYTQREREDGARWYSGGREARAKRGDKKASLRARKCNFVSREEEARKKALRARAKEGKRLLKYARERERERKSPRSVKLRRGQKRRGLGI